MKLYIPTSSLNFNNIMSSESISPKAFYSLRGFGYSRWQVVNENSFENVILLYEQPFTFSRPISDVEDHPMLIEITTDKEYPTLSDGIYYCDHTIYLSPWRTRFFFFNEQDKTVVLSLSDSSLETKMMGLYQRLLFVKTFPVKSIEKIDCKIPLNNDAIEKDCRINKLKGFLYGYYIGALLSTTQEVVKKANVLQELQNIFSSVLSAETRVPTISQHEKLTALIYELNKSNPLYQYILAVLKEDDKVDDFIKTLKGYGVSFPETIDKDGIISLLKYATEDYNPAFDWLKKERQALHSQAIQVRNYLYPSDEEIVISDGLLIKINVANMLDVQEQEVIKVWVNNIFISKEYDGKISTFAEPLSDAVTKMAKDVYGDSWEESITKVQLNQMRRYIRGSEVTIDWGNYLVSSIAAVIAKGSEWEQLYFFMQSKYITDYRIAFAFFAELNGFANLTRDFTDILFELKDRKYIAEVYKNIFSQLHNTNPVLESTQSDKDKDEYKFAEENDTALDNPSDSDYNLHFWQQGIVEYAQKEAIKKDKKKLIKSLQDALVENGDNQDYHTFFTLLSKFEGWNPSNIAWRRMKEHFVPEKKEYVQRKRNKTTTYQRNMFENVEINEKSTIQHDEFYADNNAWNLVQSIIPSEIREKVKNAFIWLQHEYQKGPNSYYYAKASRENVYVIDALSRMLLKKSYIVGIYEEDIIKAVNYLHDLYDKR